MTVHVQLQQRFLLEDLAAVLARVNLTGVVVGDLVPHEVLSKVEGFFTFVALEVRANLAVLVDVALVGFANVVSAEHSSAVLAREHQVLVVLGSDVTHQELLVFKHLKVDKSLLN
jgi:hypothetical protein